LLMLILRFRDAYACFYFIIFIRHYFLFA